MAALRNFNGLASWKNAENSLQSVNLTRPPESLLLTSGSIPRSANAASADDADRILAADLSGLVPEPLHSDDLNVLSGGQSADERSSLHVLKGRHHLPRSVQVVILA